MKKLSVLFITVTLVMLTGSTVMGQWLTNGNSVYYNNGNVGIGTANPTAKLHVTGEGRFPAANGSAYGATHFRFAGDGNNYIRGNTYIADSGGNVGIGTTNPASKLHISGGDFQLQIGVAVNEISIDGTLTDNSDSALPTEQAVKTYVDTEVAGLVSNGTANYVSKFDGTTLVNSSIYDNGKVGIGTTNPTAELHVVGEARFPAGVGSNHGATHFNYTGNGANFIRGNTYIADSGGKVGVGTALPSAKLSVKGDFRLLNGATIDEISTDGMMADDSDAAVPTEKAVKAYVDSEVSGLVENGTANYVSKFDGSTLVNSSIYDNGKVGIGTTNPTAELHVVGEARFPAGVGSNHGATHFNYTGNGANFIRGNTYIADSGGKVGVGTALPSAKLSVKGDFRLLNGATIDEISTDGMMTDDSDAAVPTEQAVKTYVDSEVSGLVENGTANYVSRFDGTTLVNSSIYDNGKVGIGTTNPTAELHVVGEARFPAGVGSNHGATHFNYTGNGANFIRGNTYIADSGGKVGVGTALPSAKLTVKGDFRLLNGATIDEISTDGMMTDDSDTAVPTEKAVKTYVDSEVSGLVENGTANYVSKFDGTSLVNSAIYENGGKVGIGTANPSATLHVTGEGRFPAANESAYGATHFRYAGDGNNYIRGNTYIADSGGKVGVGTANPTDKLDVEGNIRVNNNMIFLREDADEKDGLGYNAFASVNSALAVDGPVLFGADGGALGYGKGEDFRILLRWRNNSKVGIRTLNPQEVLHVGGNILANGSITAFSDRRFKKGIKTLDNALENVLRMRGVNYDMRTDEFADYQFSNRKQIGFIAQEVEEIIPEVVITHEDGYKSLDYMKITPVLVEAIKDQQDIIDEQQSELDALKDRVDQIEQMLQKLNGNEEEDALVEEHGVILNQNVPNPFSDMTTITYELENAGNVRLDIYDMMGRHIDSLISEYQEAGSYSMEWEADGIPSGLYIYSLMVDGKELSKRAIISRS